MSFSFASMIRLLALGAVGLTMFAVSVSRLAPPATSSRTESPVATVSINDHLLGVLDRHPRWLDAARGTVELTPLSGDDVLEVASCSPWVDAQGRRQVVGRWSNRTFDGPETVANEFGIARCTFPDGRLIDRVALENFPISPPCWLPGDRARVLYVAGDGRLRRFDFESDAAIDDPGESDAADARATVVAWDCPKPGLGDVVFSEIGWPRPPHGRFGNILLATLRVRHPGSKAGAALGRSEIWWLRLDPGTTRVVDAGLLVGAELGQGQESPSVDERSPTVALRPDGTLGLAFVRAVDGSPGWSICLATLDVLPDGRPSCREATVRVLDVRKQLGPIAFSPDGRWLNSLVAEPQKAPTVGRYRTTAAMARLDPIAPVR